jgi:hypothetical protein
MNSKFSWVVNVQVEKMLFTRLDFVVMKFYQYCDSPLSRNLYRYQVHYAKAQTITLSIKRLQVRK